MIGIICPICNKPRRRVYPHLAWARAHNPDIPPRNFRYLEGMRQPAIEYEFDLVHMHDAGFAFAGAREFCGGHED